MCQHIAALGHEVRVLCTEATDAPNFSVRTEYDGAVRVDRVNLPYFGQKDPEGWRLGIVRWRRHQDEVARLIASLTDDWKPDLAHYHGLRPLGEECFFSLARLRIPVLATTHDAWLLCPRMYLLHSPTREPCAGPAPLKCLECSYSNYDGRAKAWLKLPWRIARLGAYPAYRLAQRRRAQELVAGVTSYAEWLGEVFRRRYPDRVSHMPIGIELDGRPANRPKRPRAPLRFGFVAGFQPHKGIQDVLEACVSLQSQGLEFELHVWGPGDGQGNPVIDSGQLGDRLHLHGMYAPGERWQVYSQIDVAVMATTVVEVYGLVVQEARATGAPTIAPAVGGLAEQIREGVDGLLYRFRDAADLERQMGRLLREPELLPTLLRNQPEPLERSAALANLEQVYFETIRRGA